MRNRLARYLGMMLAASVFAAACSTGPATGEVSGTVQVDGKTPPAGSSITFFPSDGKAPSAGALIDNGRYAARVPVGTAKVEIRVPRVLAKSKAAKQGPGAEGDVVEESLPAKYNDQTELRLDVKPGKNSKDWDLKT